MPKSIVPKPKFDYRGCILTPEERANILQKEALTIDDIGRLYAFRYIQAAELLRTIRRATKDRLHLCGMVHILDYCEYFNLTLVELRGSV